MGRKKMPDDLMPQVLAAEIVGIDRRLVNVWISRDKLKVYRKAGRPWVSLSEVRALHNPANKPFGK